MILYLKESTAICRHQPIRASLFLFQVQIFHCESTLTVMAENSSPRTAQKRKSSGGDGEDGASSPKKAKAEEETRDPGKRA